MRPTDHEKPESALTTWGEPQEPGIRQDEADAELRRLWLEQIDGEIRFEGRFLTATMTSKLVDIAVRGATIPAQFRVLFSQPDPPIEMLEYAKRLAKGVRHRPDSLADRVATALYYCAIAAALVRCRRRITELDDAALAFGINWVLSQNWIDADTRCLFVDASAFLMSNPSESAS
jgi:hypothetical protein